jgi:hypothetical protein
VKTTLEIPDSLFRKAKATAARRGQTLQAFVTSALESKLKADAKSADERPWMQFAGIFKGERKESGDVMKAIDEACEKVDPEQWK